MGSYEIILKTEEMIKKMQEGDYVSAQKVLDTINLKKVKNITDLSLMAEVLSKNERNDEALELLLKVYNKIKTRKVLYQLILVSIRMENTEASEQYLKEYEDIAPDDFYKYIFRYQIDRMKGEPVDVLISTLNTLKKTEYIEQWGYELAKLYFKAGMEEECLKECSDLILWFGEGNYIEKAKMLKAYCSGEADKDKIIEELKNRADIRITNDEKENPAASEDNINGEDIEDNMASESEDDIAKEEQDTKEQGNSSDKYTVEISEEEENDSLADSIKKDVECIMSEETKKKDKNNNKHRKK